MDPSTLVLTVLIGLALVAGVGWIWVLLTRVSMQGGASDGDPTDLAAQIMAETDAFRGSGSRETPPWDGVNRLGPPTVNGGWLAWAFWLSSRSGERAKRAQVKKSG